MVQKLKLENLFGGSILKKHSTYVVVSLLFLIILASCKSLPDAQQDIDPFTLFDENASLYMSIPVIGNESHILQFATVLLPLIDTGSVEMLIERVDTLYIAIFTQQDLISRESTYFQLVATGSFPSFFVNIALSEKNGWTAITEDIDGVKYERKHTHLGFEIAIPTSDFIVVSNKNVLSMQQKYEQPEMLMLAWPSILDELGNETDVRMFLNNPDSTAVYIPMAGSLLPKILGAPIELAIDYAVGTITPYDENNLMLDLQLQMADSRATTAVMGLLGFASLMLDFIAEKKTNNIILLNNLILDSAFLAGFINQS